MSWFTRILKLNPAQISIAAEYGSAAPENIVDYKTAYNDIEIINRAIEMIINGCVEVPFVVKGGPQKKIDKLINWMPNPWEDRVRFFRACFLDFLIEGNCFILYDKDTGSLFRLPSNSVTVVPHPKKFVSHYIYQAGSSASDPDAFWTPPSSSNKPSEGEFRYGEDEVIHVMNDNFDTPFRGDSRLKSINSLIELYFTMINFQRSFFKNNAIPGLVLTTENVLSKSVKSRLLAEWRESYTAIFKGARSPAILDGGLKIDTFSNVKFSELDFENSIRRIQDDMLVALGIPPILMRSGNNANVTPNQLLFYVHTVLPILSRFASAFSLRFGPECDIYPDRLSLAALRPDAAVEANRLASLVNTGIITPNEARRELRYSPATDTKMDEIRVPQNITGSATNPSTGGKPVGLPKPPVVPLEDNNE
jgi:HK97 family phage portal protein